MKIFTYQNIKKSDYKVIANILNNSGIMIYPTETIYGLGCNGDNLKAVEKIFKIKKRNQDKGFIYIFKNIKMLKKYATIENNLEKFLIEKFWPGNLTIIFNKKNSNETIACRISSHPFITSLFNYIDFPFVSTSANLSNESYDGEIKKIKKIFKGKVDIIVDYGDLSKNFPSTIVQVLNGKIKILRKGNIAFNEIDSDVCI